MSNMKCPFCQQKLEEETFYRGRVFVSCNNPNCIISDWGGCSKQIITELIRTRKALEQSEICCTEWEKQALDYKAENIALSGELERTQKALDVAKDKLDTVRQYHRGTAVIRPNDISAYCDRALEQITAQEQKD